MTVDDLGMQLHDRSTRGETLTVEEQAQLEAWYQQQDMTEAQRLNQFSTLAGIANLHAQVETASTHLASAVQRVQQITAENEALRQEISALQQQLSTSKSV